MKLKKITVNLLGSAEIICEDTLITSNLHSKALALMAYLSTEMRPHSKNQLSYLLWPDLSKESARSNLRKTVFRLRQTLGINIFLQATTETLLFNPESFQLDVTEFLSPMGSDISCEKMETKIASYRGPFLDGVTLENCPDFEDWLTLKRETYHRHALGLLERLSDYHEQHDDKAKALQFANRYLELESWNEEIHRKVMRLLAMNGQTGAALAQFEACRRMLLKELAIPPDPETIELVKKIKAGKLRHEPNPKPAGINMTAERRQVTVLYCGICCSGETDPDEIAERLTKTRRRCSEIIRFWGGYVYQIHGGAILAYFGYPVASEKSAYKAVRAALALRELNDINLQVSSGVHTGMIIVDNELPDSVGLTTNIAIRLRDLNLPVVISETTQNVVAGYFLMEYQGFSQFGDILQTVKSYRVIAESGALHRLEAVDRLTPLVGRETEIEALSTLWQNARQGTSRTVLIRGEAGIGKSRLIHAIQEYIGKEFCAVRELHCFPEFSQSPFYPLIVLIESLCGFKPYDMPDTKLGKLVQHLKALSPKTDKDAVPLLTQMLSLPVDVPSRIPPNKQKEKLNTLLLNWLQMLAAKQPMLFIVEDLHWIDPSTLELLTSFVNGQNRGAILMLLTARPEFEHSWQKGNCAIMDLHTLDAQAVAAIVGFWQKNIPTNIIRRIMDRADGIPLFVEELAKMAQNGLGNIPATLHDLLALKLDGMGEAKYVAQRAATIGREFSIDLLREIVTPDTLLKNRLDELQDAELILCETETSYQFKHALIQEAAYQSQTKADRQTAHRKIAEVLQAGYREIMEHQPEVLARHLGAAGDTELAIHYWMIASRRASVRYAAYEAVQHYDAGLQLLPALAPGPHKESLEFQLLDGLCMELHSARGRGSAIVQGAHARLEQLCSTMKDNPELFHSLWRIQGHQIANAKFEIALESGKNLLRLANGDPLRQQQAHFALGNNLFWLGEFGASRIHLEECIRLYRPSHHQTLIDTYNENPCICARSFLSWLLWFLGLPEQSRKASEEAVRLAHQLEHPFSEAFALSFAAILRCWMGDSREALLLTEKLATMNTSVWLANVAMVRGWAQVTQGQRESIELIRQGLDRMRPYMDCTTVIFLTTLATANLFSGEHKKALDVVEEALAEIEEKRGNHLEAELYRIKGEALLGLTDSNKLEAEACLNKALEISRKQEAKALELRAAISLARHFGQIESLIQVYAGFTEGFDTPDLIEARNLCLGKCIPVCILVK